MSEFKQIPTLFIVLPCYNEEDALPESIERLTSFYDGLISEGVIAESSRLMFVNDGSRDRTWEIIREAHETNKYVCGVNLAANVGHQCAILSGMDSAREYADIVVTMDADLQDDLSKIPEMIRKYTEGADIVYGVKNERKADSLFKRTTARMFYGLMKRLGVKSIYNRADFRLMSRRALEQLTHYRERNLYLRGIIPMLGYKTDVVYEDLSPRKAGESKYSLSKMMNLAVDGITSFSIMPVRMVLMLGIVFLLIAFCILVYVLCMFFGGNTVPGWSSIMLSIWFVGGFILVGLGIVGEYIGRIYLEVKDRPRYNIETKLIK